MDRSDGTYELTAAVLEPAAARVVEHADVKPRQRVLDLGCGTGNVALEAPRAGASVVAMDLAVRLLEANEAGDRARSPVAPTGRREMNERGTGGGAPLPSGRRREMNQAGRETLRLTSSYLVIDVHR